MNAKLDCPPPHSLEEQVQAQVQVAVDLFVEKEGNDPSRALSELMQIALPEKKVSISSRMQSAAGNATVFQAFLFHRNSLSRKLS